METASNESEEIHRKNDPPQTGHPRSLGMQVRSPLFRDPIQSDRQSAHSKYNSTTITRNYATTIGAAGRSSFDVGSRDRMSTAPDPKAANKQIESIKIQAQGKDPETAKEPPGSVNVQ